MNEPIRYIILNGPPGSGKSTISVELVRNLRHIIGNPEMVVSDSFAAPIKHFIAAALSEKYQSMDKERARPELNGHSVRQALIRLAEDHIKEVYGRDIFGKWLIHRSLKYPHKRTQFVVVDDGGFPEEILTVPNRIVIRVEREGKDFKCDSRRYVDGYDIMIDNSKDMAHLWSQVADVASVITKMVKL